MKIGWILLLFLSMNFVYGQDGDVKQDKKENQYQGVLELVKSGVFVFEADKTFQKKGTMVDLTTNPNYLRIEDGEAQADLPFWGETYQVHDMGGDAGINFEGEMMDYNETVHDKKMNIDIKFEVKTNTDRYSCYLNIHYDGDASLVINSMSKSTARYYGKVREMEDE